MRHNEYILHTKYNTLTTAQAIHVVTVFHTRRKSSYLLLLMLLLLFGDRERQAPQRILRQLDDTAAHSVVHPLTQRHTLCIVGGGGL